MARRLAPMSVRQAKNLDWKACNMQRLVAATTHLHHELDVLVDLE